MVATTARATLPHMPVDANSVAVCGRAEPAIPYRVSAAGATKETMMADSHRVGAISAIRVPCVRRARSMSSQRAVGEPNINDNRFH
jgi:hypothetical protein